MGRKETWRIFTILPVVKIGVFFTGKSAKPQQDMKDTVIKTWPLFFGIGMMMVSNGLQGTLLGVRASIEEFSVFTTGFIMSAYYLGFLYGTYKVPIFISNVGHIRVFAALASLASTTVLVYVLVVDPLTWAILRAVAGFAYAGLFIVVESWLNDSATNKTRGMIMGLYMVTTYIGMAFGQLLLNVADPSEAELFVITSALVSLALIPISLSRRPAPEFGVSDPISFFTIWRRSPLGIFGVMASGLASACIFAIGPVFAVNIGLSNASVSAFMASFLIGSVLFQMPVAWMSDRMDRRKMIIFLGGGSACVAALLWPAVDSHSWIIFIVMFALGGVCLPIYSQSISHVNDHLLPRQFVAASSTLLLLNGVGAAMGPMLVTTLMQFFGDKAFIVLVSLVFATIGLFGIYRSIRAAPVPLEDQGDSILLPARGGGVRMYMEED